MKVLLIGSGGREHALGWKLTQSPKLTKLFVAPGNGGTAQVGENVALDVTDHEMVATFCAEQGIDLVIVGPEAPLVNGLADDLRAAGLVVFGPSARAAQLEGSKAFTKALCDRMNIPTAAYQRFANEDDALAHVRAKGAPIVVKADGLAAGKGVTVAETVAEAEHAIRECFAGAFGAAGAEVVIEECLVGEEASIFAICDGKSFVTLASAQDHKRVGDGDTGPNTGGMGAYSPAPAVSDALLGQIEREIIAPTFIGMAEAGMPFQGVLFAGLMLTKTGPKLIEHNVRFGDPECQVLMMRLRSDLLELLVAAASGDLAGVKPEWRDEAALTVVMAARGYPGSYDTGSVIGGLEALGDETLQVFHAGTKAEGGKVLASGGRVLSITALGATVAEAQARAYRAVDAIDWPEGFCRRDIGWRAVGRELAKP
ncbi:MAG: phosphoribosylamine--glycine ligase [Alphaproteobacteria bacterium]|nr:phosphoribosylamine--glycine ligase [Alphaproteobacteria bacterium]